MKMPRPSGNGEKQEGRADRVCKFVSCGACAVQCMAWPGTSSTGSVLSRRRPEHERRKQDTGLRKVVGGGAVAIASARGNFVEFLSIPAPRFIPTYQRQFIPGKPMQ